MPAGVAGGQRLGIVHGIEEFAVGEHLRPDTVLEHVAQQFREHAVNERMDGRAFLVKMDGGFDPGSILLRVRNDGEAELQRQGGEAAEKQVTFHLV